VVIRPVIAMIACAGCNQILGNAGSFAGPRLAALRITAGTLVPAFSPETFEYTVDVGNAIAQARVIATAMDTLELDSAELRSGQLSRPITLAEDATTDLHVQVADVVYTIHVHRGAALAKQSVFKPNGTRGGGDMPDPPPLYGDAVGFAVATDGTTLVAGAPGVNDSDSVKDCGAVFVYRRNEAGAWTFDTMLPAPRPIPGALFGGALAVQGDLLVVGARGENAAYVFDRAGGSWQQEARLEAAQPGPDDFGGAVALDRDLIVVGARLEAGSGRGVDPPVDRLVPGSGAAYVFRKTGNSWLQVYLKASNAEQDDWFGSSVAVQDGVVFVGASRESSCAQSTPDDNSCPNSGAIYVYAPHGQSFDAPVYVKPPIGQDQHNDTDGVGSSLAIDGDLLVSGAVTHVARTGRVVAFRKKGTDWTLAWSLVGPASASNFGVTVGLVSDTIVVGAPTTGGGLCQGNLYIFTPTATDWEEVAQRRNVNVDVENSCEEFAGAVAIGRDGLIAAGAQNDARSDRGILDPSDTSFTNQDGGSGAVLTLR
jgi:hypothetical protein